MQQQPIYYIDRTTSQKKQESVYGGSLLELLYGTSLASRVFGRFIGFLVSRISFFSALYGKFQRRSASKKSVQPFIEKYQINSKEFLENVSEFASFDAFFSRKLKKEARPLAQDPMAIIPADGRFLFFPRIDHIDHFIIKGKSFNLKNFLKNEEQAKRYQQGTLIIGRLCPTDYHRFHFPCDCIPGVPKLIDGALFSVNPIALKQNIEIFYKNKRMVTELETLKFGKVVYAEIGATNVGSIHQTFVPYQAYKKGDEKGFFSFGGSALVLLFEEGAIQLQEDLLAFSQSNFEILCAMGQPLGKPRP